MLSLETPSDYDAYVGRSLGTGEWLTVTQAMIDGFADATDDHQWIHVDVERAAREMPEGKTIAHGYLTLSLLAKLERSVVTVRRRGRGLNYGCNKVRFLSPVMVGCRLRSHKTLKASEPIEGGRRLTFESTIEIEGQTKPALIAETMSILFD